VLACVVVLLTLSLGWAQIVHLAPVVAGDSSAVKTSIVLVTLSLLANVFFNYFLCASPPAGAVEVTPKPVVFRDDGFGIDAGVDRYGSHGQDRARRQAERASLRELDAVDSEKNARNDESIPKGVFDGCRPCVPCGAAKPKGAHHCSTCRTCVQQMDHHCPFVANCVGGDNMRHFMVFLLYVAVGNAFGVFLGYRAGVGNGKDAFEAFWRRLHSRERFEFGWTEAHEGILSGEKGVFGVRVLTKLVGPPPETMKALIRSGSITSLFSALAHGSHFFLAGVSAVARSAFRESPDWIGWWAWQICVGGMIGIATGVLLWSTVRGVASGETYVDSLRRERDGAGAANRSASSVDEGTVRNWNRSVPTEGRRLSSISKCLERITRVRVIQSTGPSPWSETGAFRLRQVFGSGPVALWPAPRRAPPPGSRNGAQRSKKGT
jgi:palmitoyltransferase